MRPWLSTLPPDHERERLESGVRSLLSRLAVGSGQGSDPGSAVERIHFYLVYHGRHAHDRVMQELISQLYLRAWPGLLSIAPHCQPHLALVPSQRQAPVKVRPAHGLAPPTTRLVVLDGAGGGDWCSCVS